MDGLLLALVVLEAVGLIVLVGVVRSRGRALRAVDDALEDPRSARDDASATRSPVDAGRLTAARQDRVRRLRERAARADGAETERDQRLSDLAYLADLVGVGIVRLSDRLVVQIANTAAHVFLRREPGTMVGRTAIEAVGDHRVEALAQEAAAEGSAGGEVALVDEPADDANRAGARLLVRARRSPIGGLWLVLEDVAELRRLQRIRAEFIDNLSHELRTPITTVGLLVESLARDAEGAEAGGAPVPTKMRERIGKLEVETGNIAQMVAELLDLARIESGGRQLHLDDVDLGRVAAESADRLRPFAERQGVSIHVTVVPDLPSVRGEAARLSQVFANLIHNAVKFSSAGSEVRVTVSHQPTVDGEEGASRPMLVATVSDDGAGIARADLPRIFERFYKADRTRTTGGGTGLGLAIARHIVAGHGGAIRVDSEEGAGATFSFTIPVAEAAGRAVGATAAGEVHA